jgi:uncharacterized protein YbjQ (UPF0145 family)
MSARPVPALSDLSVTEFLTLARLGFLPHGLVIGCAIWDAGTPFGLNTLAYSNRVENALSLALTLRLARQTALRRMTDQAHALGAEGIVGVRLTLEHHAWRGGHQVVKILAVGTAIGVDPNHAPREFAGAPSLALAGGAPFTSDLSGQDFVALLRAGYRPIALATGNAIYAIDTTSALASMASFKNEEMTAYTQAFFDAREEAMETMTTDLFRMFPPGSPDAAAGVVGMHVDEDLRGGRTGYVEFTAYGTAIAPARPGDPRVGATHPTPQIVVPLDR